MKRIFFHKHSSGNKLVIIPGFNDGPPPPSPTVPCRCVFNTGNRTALHQCPCNIGEKHYIQHFGLSGLPRIHHQRHAFAWETVRLRNHISERRSRRLSKRLTVDRSWPLLLRLSKCSISRCRIRSGISRDPYPYLMFSEASKYDRNRMLVVLTPPSPDRLSPSASQTQFRPFSEFHPLHALPKARVTQSCASETPCQ